MPGEEWKKSLPGAVSNEDYRAWVEYQKAGGLHGLYDWISLGKPPVGADQDIWDYLNTQLLEYLGSQITGKLIDEKRADEIFRSEYQRAFGLGAFKERQPLSSLPYWTTVQAARTEAAQTEAAAKAKQEALLPLKEGGTPQEQMWKAFHTIESLARQRETAPESLKPIIQGQIAELQDFIKTQKQTERAKVAGRGDETERLLLNLWERRRTEPQMGFNDWLYTPEGLAAHKYAFQKTGGQYVLESERIPEEAPAPFQPPGFREVATTGGVNWRDEFERRYPTILREYAKQEPKTGERWVEFLAKRRKDIKEQFTLRSPYEQGQRPAAFAPRIKTIKFG